MVSVAAVFEDIKVVLIVSSFLLVWFKTDFLYSYLKLVGLKNSNYEEMAESVDLSYVAVSYTHLTLPTICSV